MLNADTKRRINAARDILVGKVPDPKAQVEQITTALIYKFMWDMDRQSEEIGGKLKFFVGDFKKFSWANLIDSRLAGQERLDLYVRAITSFSKNKDLPQLFRDIFKDSFLPFRDPETLSLFLKEIDGFTYGHSEDLGDAFEYLLLILGSQGDAGQFRTPRHIIDFIVEVVAPTVDDTVLDPACGTAGFLISAYKHIRSRHAVGVHGIDGVEKPLTPAQRKRLMQNFVGYDISPDMVRIALVNLYLHGFPEPKIYEYDTLSSEERWDERFDVILANPPFMSPKGGIRPHKHFSVQANRAEVLFVDYIMEHLTPKGRAGIIVPEGIIFQSSGAYKQLRKLLVEDGLYAVVSLPSGVFNPYSGVKTSILFFDNQVAKKTDDILFVKVEHDGYDLGAQRRETPDKNDLPEALRILQEYKENTLRHPGPGPGIQNPAPALVVIASGAKQSRPAAHLIPKSRIAASGDYNLTGDRYQSASASRGCEVTGKWPRVKLGEVCEINPKKSEIAKMPDDTVVAFLPMADLGQGEINIEPQERRKLGEVRNGYTYFRDGDVVFAKVTPCFENRKAGLARGLSSGIGFGSSEYIVLRPNDNILPEILYHIISSPKFIEGGRHQMTGTGGLKRLSRKYVEDFEFGLPPLEVQKEIAAELDGYQHIIHGAKKIIANWKPKIEISPKWEVKTLGEISELEYGYTAVAKESGDARFIRITDIDGNGELIGEDKKFIELTDEAKKYLLKKDDVLVARTGATYGKTVLFDGAEKAVFASFLIRINLDKKEISPKYYWIFARSPQYWAQANSLVTGGGQPQFNGNALKQIKVPLPPLETQLQIVAKIEKERHNIQSLAELVKIEENTVTKILKDIYGLCIV